MLLLGYLYLGISGYWYWKWSSNGVKGYRQAW